MTVVLEFARDPKQLDDMSLHPMEADAGDLESSLLRQDIDFLVNEVTILDHTPVSLLLLSFWALNEIRALPAKKHIAFEIPEGSLQLIFDIQGDNVAVRETYYRRQATTHYSELLQAWERFAAEAKTYLLSEIPELADHPEVGSWFAE